MSYLLVEGDKRFLIGLQVGLSEQGDRVPEADMLRKSFHRIDLWSLRG